VCKTALYLEKGKVKSIGNVNAVINEYERHLHEESARKLDVLRKGKDIKVGHDLLITKVEVSGGEKGSVDCLNSKEPAMVLIHYQAYREAKVNIAANIIRSDGLTCCMVRTSLDKFPVSVSPGEGIVSLTLEPLQLIGGSYYVETFFLNESDSMGLTSKSSDWFNVKGTGLSYEERSGVFEPKTKWNHFHNSL
jgi:lipopolysaccharide transport system ATP-binding protein